MRDPRGSTPPARESGSRRRHRSAPPRRRPSFGSWAPLRCFADATTPRTSGGIAAVAVLALEALRPLQGSARSGFPLRAAYTCYILNHMVQYTQTHFNASFAALSDVTRRGVLEQLARA